MNLRAAAIEQLHHRTAIYTTPAAVSGVLDTVDWPKAGGRLVDPSAGDGAFLAEALRRLLGQLHGIREDVILDRLAGWEIHPEACSDARVRVGTVLIQQGCGWSYAAHLSQLLVNEGDFLTQRDPARRYDFIVGNPPYLRYVNVPQLLRSEYELRLPRHARSDMLHSFLQACADSLTGDGQIAFVTADRWLINVGARILRAELGTKLSIDGVTRLDPLSAFYRPKQRRAGTPPRIHPVSFVLKPSRRGGQPLSMEPIYPDAPGVAQAGTVRLDSVAKIRIAPWLGTPGIFVVDEVTARRLPPTSVVPAVDTDDVAVKGFRRPRRYAIRTMPDREPPATVLVHLDRELHAMAPRGRRNPRWLPPETWHRLDLSKPALVVPRISRTLKPYRLKAGILPINHNLHIIAAGSMSLAAIERALLSKACQDWIRQRAARLENGYLSITTTLLRQLPVPAK